MEKILLAGHGSPKQDANNIETVAGLLHNMIHPGCSANCIGVAYLQFAKPDIMEAITASVKEGAKKIIVHPYFLTSGMHVTKDIPEIIAKAKEIYPGVKFVYTEPLGINSKLIQLVAERIEAAAGLSPYKIEEKSFDIISGETDLSDIPSERHPIVKRVIHTTADFEFKSSLVFHPEAVKAGVAAIKAGKDILTDVEMVRTGIFKKMLEKWGGKVICNIQTAESVGAGLCACPTQGQPQGSSLAKTKAETGIESALRENSNIGIIAIGNAPTALLKAIELLNQSPISNPKPLVVGVPVGFVKALESKSLLAAQSFPFITNLSRKGGSTVAVAIVNALLKIAEAE